VEVHLLVGITCESLLSTTDNGARVDDAARLGVTTSVRREKHRWYTAARRPLPSGQSRPLGRVSGTVPADPAHEMDNSLTTSPLAHP